VLAEDGAEFVGIGGCCHQAADFSVVLVVWVFRPSVEAPFNGDKLRT